MNAKKSKKGKALHRGKKLAAKKTLSKVEYLPVTIKQPLISG